MNTCNNCGNNQINTNGMIRCKVLGWTFFKGLMTSGYNGQPMIPSTECLCWTPKE